MKQTRKLNYNFPLFVGCESFFLRHTKSGKCIAGGSSFEDKNKTYADLHWAEMVNNCLNSSAQFHYLDSGLVENIEKKGTLAANYKDSQVYKTRLFIFASKNKEGKGFQTKKRHHLKQTSSQSLVFPGKKAESCAQPNGAYVHMKNGGCQNIANQKFTFGKKTSL